ncbi:winged helix DNA-binding protein [Halorubraceae archaeon YAN]|nr:winged helix DNA-binding protein [Halorubraceae archaeon YAN]
MSIHIVPHGRATEHIHRSLRAFGSVETVYLLTSDAFLDTGDNLATDLDRFGYKVHRRTIDAFDLRDVVDTIVDIAKDNLNEPVYVNITGGTNLVAGGATSSAFFVGAKPYYVLEPQTGEESIDDLVMQLPTPKQPLTFEIDGLQRDVLTTVGMWDEKGRTGVIYREIGDELGEAAQKISYHVNRLAEQGLLETENDGRSKRVYLTDMGRLYLSWTS